MKKILMKKWLNKPYDSSITSDYIIPTIILVSAIVILIGRYFKIESLMAEDYGLVRTTIPTLMFFVNSAIIIIFIRLKCIWKYMAYHWLILWLIILTSYFFVYPTINFVFDSPGLLQVPSVTTFTCFWLFAIGIHYRPQIMGFGILCVAISAQMHYLYWYDEAVFVLKGTTAMAVSTSIMFIALSTSLIISNQKKLL